MKDIQELNENLLTTLNNVVEKFLNDELKEFPDLFRQYTKQTMLLTDIIYNVNNVYTYIFNIVLFNNFEYNIDEDVIYNIGPLLYNNLSNQLEISFIQWLRENNFGYQVIENKNDTFYFEKFGDDIIFGCTLVDTEY